MQGSNTSYDGSPGSEYSPYSSMRDQYTSFYSGMQAGLNSQGIYSTYSGPSAGNNNEEEESSSGDSY